MTRRLQEDLALAHRQLETAYEELQSTNEELETTNEELQSTVEELETTNEELQSTNEELETTNEELQSTNDELQTMNDELRERELELDTANAFLAGHPHQPSAGVARGRMRSAGPGWNRRAREPLGPAVGGDRGQHFLNLDIGLPTERLRLRSARPSATGLASPGRGSCGGGQSRHSPRR